MHWGKISVVSVIASMMTCGASAEEGVVVDLDVLNNLDAGYYSAQEPLFPVLPKRPVNQVKKKNVVKTAKPLPTVKAENSTSSMDIVYKWKFDNLWKWIDDIFQNKNFNWKSKN